MQQEKTIVNNMINMNKNLCKNLKIPKKVKYLISLIKILYKYIKIIIADE